MSPGKRAYTSARTRLLELGELGDFFEGRHAMQVFGWDSKTAAHYLWSWSGRGLIVPLGGKSDVYFNLVANPRAIDHFEAAVRRAMPGAVIGARNVLHAAGITTQRPGLIHLLARPDERKLSIGGAIVETRSPTWWRTLDGAAAFDPGTETALARLKPGAALADSALCGDGFAPDDIDFDAVTPRDRRLALGILGRLSPARDGMQNLESAYRRVWIAGHARHAKADGGATRETAATPLRRRVSFPVK